MELELIGRGRASTEASITPKRARSGSQKGVNKMRIGTFFILLLVALIALGYLLSDSLHLRAAVSTLREENARLIQVLQHTEERLQQIETARQETLAGLETATQELIVCQQTVEQANETIARQNNEIASLNEQNEILASQQTANPSSASALPETNTIQATTFGLLTFLTLGAGSLVAIGLRRLEQHTRHGDNTGQYVCLTEAEIRELIQRRRRSKRANTAKSRD